MEHSTSAVLEGSRCLASYVSFYYILPIEYPKSVVFESGNAQRVNT